MNNTDVRLSTSTAPPSASGDPMVMIVAYGVIGSVGIFSNGLVIFVLIRVSQTRQGINIFIINQSLIDLLTSLMLILCYVVPPVQFPAPYFSESFGRFVCRFWYSRYPSWGGIIASTANLVCLTLERYMAVICPVRYQRLFKWPRSILLATLPWLGGYAYQTYWIFMHSLDKETGKCGIRTSKEVQVAAGVAAFVVQYSVPLIVMAFVYVRIAKSLSKRVDPANVTKRSQAPSTASPSQVGAAWGSGEGAGRAPIAIQPNFRVRARRNVIKTLILVCVAFFICWTPNQICYILFNTGYSIDKTTPMFRLTIILAFCNMVINPFIYAFKYRVFKQGLLKTIPCLQLALDGSGETSTAPTRLVTNRTNQNSLIVCQNVSRTNSHM